jgi:hypothetical protein
MQHVLRQQDAKFGSIAWQASSAQNRKLGVQAPARRAPLPGAPNWRYLESSAKQAV